MTNNPTLRRFASVSRRLFLGAALVVLAIAIAACGGGSDDGSGGQTPVKQNLNVQVASYDLAANRDSRFIAGLLTLDNDFVSYGTVQMRFTYLGQNPEAFQPQFYQEKTASFLQIPGEGQANPPDAPQAGPASQGRGVYAVNPINFDRAGYWQVDVSVKVNDKQLQGGAAFAVVTNNIFAAPGDRVPSSDNLTVKSTDVPPAAIDSRAQSIQTIPDPELHQMTIAEALQQDKPLVVVLATPVFCVSQFCGPVTDMVAGLQKQYGDRANFIHIEIWNDFQKQAVNKSAAPWVLRNGDIWEPWVYLIGKDGTILNRWDNVATQGEIVPALEKAIGG